MKKLLKILLIVVPILVIVGLTVLYFSLGSIIRTGVETMAPKVTKTSVTLEDFDFSLFSGKIDIKGVTVGNPEGFKTPSAFKLDRVRVVVAPGSLLSDRIVVREIYIDGPQITYELSLSGSNIGRLKENVEAFAGMADGAPAEPAEAEPESGEDEGPGKKVQIDDFLLKNGKVSLSATVMGGKALTVPLPEVHLTDIGKESGGKSMGEIVSEIFAAVASSITEVASGAGDLLKTGGEALQDSAGKAGETVKEGASNVLKGVKGMFGK